MRRTELLAVLIIGTAFNLRSLYRFALGLAQYILLLIVKEEILLIVAFIKSAGGVNLRFAEGCMDIFMQESTLMQIPVILDEGDCGRGLSVPSHPHSGHSDDT